MRTLVIEPGLISTHLHVSPTGRFAAGVARVSLFQSRRQSEQRDEQFRAIQFVLGITESADPCKSPARSAQRDRVERSTQRRNTTLTGEPTFTSGPTGVRAPLRSLMRNTASVSLSWLAAMSHAPVGSIVKLRGVLPRVDSCSTSVRLPLAAPTW